MDASRGDRTSSRRAPSRLLAAAVLSLLAPPLAAGCAPEEQPERPPMTVERLDSVLTELGGITAERLDRGQRWRMIASVGTGLPPVNYSESDLPEPNSRGAAMLKVYCDRCHWLPAPAMHSAEEWPLLVRRMQLRAHTLQRRMGGPLTEGLMGDVMMQGLATTELDMAAPTEAVDSLTSYLQRNALPTVEPEELGQGADVTFYRQICATCHELPDPAAHTAMEWETVLQRMNVNMRLMDVEPMERQEMTRILEFLQQRAAGG